MKKVKVRNSRNNIVSLEVKKNIKNLLDAIAKMAIERKIGARGLRLITEDLMLDAMYELPSTENVTEFVVTREMVENKDVVFKLLEKAG